MPTTLNRCQTCGVPCRANFCGCQCCALAPTKIDYMKRVGRTEPWYRAEHNRIRAAEAIIKTGGITMTDPIPHDLATDGLDPHEDFDDDIFEMPWLDEVKQIAARLQEIKEDMEADFNKCGPHCDHLDEFSHLYSCVSFAISDALCNYLEDAR